MTPQKKNLVVVGEGSVAEEQLLGRVTFFSLPDEPIAGDALTRAWTDAGLDPALLPDMRKPVNVFQSACASVSSRAGSGNGRVEVRSDEVENTPGRCSYQITRVVWDLDNRVIEHEKALRLEFDKRTQAIRSERLDHFDPALEDLERQVRAHYEANMTNVPGAKVRTALRHVILSLGGQNLRRKAGGLYFVPTKAPGNKKPTGPVLAGLASAINVLYGLEGDVHTLPCVNGEGERAMVRKHVTLNAKESAQKLAQKAYSRVHDTLSDRAPREDFIANLYNERRTLMQGLDQFKELVNLEMTDVDQSLAELDAALEELDKLASEAAA